MSDHGDMLGEHGLQHKGPWFYEGLVRVPLIISWPGKFQQGLRARGLVELTDLAPTLAELAGLPVGWTHGRSLLPILRGERDPQRHHEFVRCEFYNALAAPTPSFATMYRDERYKLVVNHDREDGQLFDLTADPGEAQNRWENADLRCRLLKRSFDASVVITDPGSPRVGRY